MDSNHKEVLSGKKAFAIWAQGKQVWNLWVEEHPDADVIFQDMVFPTEGLTEIFSEDLDTEFEGFDFEGFNFPNGYVDFSGCRFGKANLVSFKGASFGRKGVSFKNAHFGNAHVDFSDAKFSTSSVNFSGVCFGDGHSSISFRNAEFNCEDINFSFTRFGWGYVDFAKCTFKGSNINFMHAKFTGELVKESDPKGYYNRLINFSQARFQGGRARFSEAQFGDRELYFADVIFSNTSTAFDSITFGANLLDFSNTIFENGPVVFSQSKIIGAEVRFNSVQFLNGYINFSRSDFCNSILSFDKAKFGKTKVNFQNIVFGSSTKFSDIEIDREADSFSFRFSDFRGSFEFSTNAEITVIPDLVGTKTNNHVSLRGLRCSMKRNEKGVRKAALDTSDSERFGRLKEIAESNKDHESALRFHADEMRAKRWNSVGIGASLLDALFDVTSRYGQSIARPFLWLLFFMISLTLYTVGYVPYSPNWFDNMKSIDTQTWLNGFNVALNKTIPFLASVKEEGKTAYQTLNDAGVLPEHYGPVSTLFFALPSFILLFLIGLGLRNRFRV
ncbi:pentapeptide repeat-containing protein [Vibrio vulnificus]|uniref:pentapeptide repeat-containing protein n=1 Tax=Vibrio vulnificus TaxID=672 RepID=UPI0010230422|nr:pentapeptide repeat-containing protein [Vibrio vulnificus]RZP68429.1 pentapeptide repeat-containing protein [Vibrio vulnificus]RZR15312.1 pentapeptide repeat-containing protein [Vibrio vulnificus]